MSKLTKVEYLNNAQTTIEAKNKIIEAKRDALSIDQFESEKQLSDAMRFENNRIRENNLLLVALSKDDLASIFFSHKIKIDELVSAKYANTREFKKRFIATIQAISKNDREHLLDCDDLVYSSIARKALKSKDITLNKVMSVMNHKSKTQASYLANLATYLNFAEKTKDASEQACVSFKEDSSLFKKIMSLYA